MKRALVVDDKDANLYYLDVLLKGHGWTVDTARHGAEALTKARLAPPDLVISDLLMPVMDGYTLLRHWRADKRLKDIPFIVYTATYTRADDEQLAMRLGADAFILKPAEPDDFLASMGRVLGAQPRPSLETVSLESLGEEGLLKSYSESLIRKLEDKSLELEETNKALQRDIAERQRTEARLHKSEEALRQLADTQVAILNALPAHIALVDARGVIVSVNESWKRFASANILQSPAFGVGSNYIEVCERASGECSEEARETGLGIRQVLEGKAGSFSLEYPCHSPDEERWFRLMVTPLREDCQVGAVVMHLNVTERRKTEMALRDREALLSIAVRASKLGGWNVSLPDRRLTWSDETAIIHDELPGFSPSVEAAIDYYIVPDRLRIAQAFEACVVDGSPFDLEAQLNTIRGRRVWVRTIGVPERDASGKIVSVQGALQDISDFKRAEDAQRLLTERLATTLESITDGFYTLDLDWRFTYVNAEAERMLQRAREDMLGISVWKAFPEAVGTRIESEYRSALESGATAVFEEYYAPLAKFFEVRAYPSEQGLAVYFRDVTAAREADRALRQSEERFRELAETIQVVFWITDAAKTQMHYVSPAYESIWGRSLASLYEAPQTWLEAIHPDDRERVRSAALAKQARGEYNETYRVIRPDGMVRWINDRAFPVRDATGAILRIVGTAEDVTQHRMLEEQFRQAQKMEAIGQLASGVAHDFNNILAAILGNVQLALADTAPGHPAHESLEEVRKASIRARSLVQQILAFSRHQSHERHVIDLGPTIKEAIAFLRASIPAVVELEVSIDASAPSVMADAAQIHQVIANLCTNAWQAIDDRPGRIEVKLEAVTLDAVDAGRLRGLVPGRFACLTVADDGKGMDEATLEKIFNPFFTTKAPGAGTGLGLSVVHGIVESHAGAISVSSLPGQGTSFRLYFPAAVARPEASAPAAPAAPTRGEGQHILYLDDEEALVFLATRMLERLGYRISGFTRAEDALDAFRKSPRDFDLVITDLNMPGVLGVQVARQMLEIRADMPIVLCSGHVSEELLQQAREAGIREVLYKPNTMEEFSQAIHRLASGQAPK